MKPLNCSTQPPFTYHFIENTTRARDYLTDWLWETRIRRALRPIICINTEQQQQTDNKFAVKFIESKFNQVRIYPPQQQQLLPHNFPIRIYTLTRVTKKKHLWTTKKGYLYKLARKNRWVSSGSLFLSVLINPSKYDTCSLKRGWVLIIMSEIPYIQIILQHFNFMHLQS